MTAALRAEGLGKRYGRVWGLRGCTLELPAEAVIGLVGPNGAGKSTLLALTVGLLRPTEGRIAVYGDSGRSQNRQCLARVAYMAQEHPLFPNFSVADMFHLGRVMNPSWDQSLAVSRMASLSIPLDRRVKQLSGGQQAQVALTLALAKRAALLVLDEPVASLDPVARVEFMQALMEAVAESELTVMVASHVVAELQRICDWIVVLNGGAVRLAGAVDDLLAGHRLLTGPRSAADAVVGVVQRRDSERHTNLLVRADPTSTEMHPHWQTSPVGLEELVLAYLQHADTDTPASAPTLGEPHPAQTPTERMAR